MVKRKDQQPLEMMEMTDMTTGGSHDGGLGRPGTGPATDGSTRAAHEDLLRGLFADMLGLESVSADDDFFELGGQSLLAIRLWSRIRKATGLNIGMTQLFETPTVAAIAECLANAPAALQARPRLAQRR